MRGTFILAAVAAAAAAFRLVRRFAPAVVRETLPDDRPNAALPPHHVPGGGFRNPWPTANPHEQGGVLRWQRERRSRELPANPRPEALPLAKPRIAQPRGSEDELRITWVGHSTFLIQIGGFNLLTDPHWSRRASPVQFAGPSRFVPPGVGWGELPPIDAVILSHDHYDHLDDGTVRRLNRRFGRSLRWFAPLAHGPWLRHRGIHDVVELDWWQNAQLDGRSGSLRLISLPCQHWTSRSPWDRQRKLWASWAMLSSGGRSVYFGGDSGYFPEYPRIRDRFGTFDALLLPIGAYEPRWFMQPVHMNPEEAVRAYRDLGASGLMVGSHWGTWRLTDEDPLEPPVRTRAAWQASGLPTERLWIPQHGETRVVA